MPTVLFAWELGSGLGHLLPYRPVADRLRAMGHQVVFASGDVTKARRLLPDDDHVAAPVENRSAAVPQETPRSYAHLLHNVGFDTAERLEARAGRWRELLDELRPDLVVADHAPTILVALRGLSVPRVIAGTGFCCPPQRAPWPDLRTWLPAAPNQLLQSEDRLLGTINRVLRSLGGPKLTNVGQLYGETDSTLLSTYRELDPYSSVREPEARYFGTWPVDASPPPAWPQVRGPRVFCYLTPDSAPVALRTLMRLGYPTMAVMPSLSSEEIARRSSATLRLVQGPIDLVQVAGQADVAILNANLYCTAEFLLAGIPILQIPGTLDQALTARATTRIGAGLIVQAGQTASILSGLSALTSRPNARIAAEAFAAQYRRHARGEMLDHFVDSLVEYATRESTVCG